jgi:hypothetical protein
MEQSSSSTFEVCLGFILSLHTLDTNFFRLGSSLTLLGEADECSFDIWLDGSTSTGMPGNGRLAELSQLDHGDHRMLMTVHPSVNGSMIFRGATLEVTPPNVGYVSELNDWRQLLILSLQS